MNIRDVSNRLGVTYTTVLNYMRRGNLRGIRRGGLWDVSEEEVARFEREGNHKDDIINLNEVEENP